MVICPGEQTEQEGGDSSPGAAVPPAGARAGGGAGPPPGWQAGHHVSGTHKFIVTFTPLLLAGVLRPGEPGEGPPGVRAPHHGGHGGASH